MAPLGYFLLGHGAAAAVYLNLPLAQCGLRRSPRGAGLGPRPQRQSDRIEGGYRVTGVPSGLLIWVMSAVLAMSAMTPVYLRLRKDSGGTANRH